MGIVRVLIIFIFSVSLFNILFQLIQGCAQYQTAALLAITATIQATTSGLRRLRYYNLALIWVIIVVKSHFFVLTIVIVFIITGVDYLIGILQQGAWWQVLLLEVISDLQWFVSVAMQCRCWRWIFWLEFHDAWYLLWHLGCRAIELTWLARRLTLNVTRSFWSLDLGLSLV